MFSKHNKSKFLAFLVILCCFVLVGCGETKQEASTKPNEAKSNVTTETKTTEQKTQQQLSTHQDKKLEQNEVKLGEIYLGMSYDEVIKNHGKPSREEQGYAQLVRKVIFYGNDVEIGFLNKKVRYVTVTADNGWKTPAGLHVGMSMKEAIDIYGTEYQSISPPAKRPANSPNSPFYELRWQGVRYNYRCVPSDVYTYKQGDTSWVLSITNSNQAKKVDAITIMEITPES